MTPRPQGPTVGLDVGASKILACLVDPHGRLLASHRTLMPAAAPSHQALEAIGDAVNAVRGDHAVAVGIGCAGQVHPTRGIVHTSPNLPTWHDVPLADTLARRLGLPVTVTNDVRAATWGEYRHGAGQGTHDMVFLAIGTGVGGGIISHDRLLVGATGTAGEFGHAPIVAGGRPCTCRAQGCLEAYIGGWALARRAQESARAEPAAAQGLLRHAATIEDITAPVLAKAHADHDPLARRLVDEAAHHLGAACVGIANTLSPEMLVLGGGVMQGLPMLAQSVRQAIADHAFPAVADRLRVETTRLGGNAGAIGAATLARDATAALQTEPKTL